MVIQLSTPKCLSGNQAVSNITVVTVALLISVEVQHAPWPWRMPTAPTHSASARSHPVIEVPHLKFNNRTLNCMFHVRLLARWAVL